MLTVFSSTSTPTTSSCHRRSKPTTSSSSSPRRSSTTSTCPRRSSISTSSCLWRFQEQPRTAFGALQYQPPAATGAPQQQPPAAYGAPPQQPPAPTTATPGVQPGHGFSGGSFGSFGTPTPAFGQQALAINLPGQALRGQIPAAGGPSFRNRPDQLAQIPRIYGLSVAEADSFGDLDDPWCLRQSSHLFPR